MNNLSYRQSLHHCGTVCPYSHGSIASKHSKIIELHCKASLIIGPSMDETSAMFPQTQISFSWTEIIDGVVLEATHRRVT